MTGSIEGEAVWELISWLAALACRAIRPSFLPTANMMSCSVWADKALRGEISLLWVNKQPASSTEMPEIGFSRTAPRVKGLRVCV